MESLALAESPQGAVCAGEQDGFPCSLQAQEACGPLEIDSALSLVQSLERDLQEAKTAARDGKLKPLPGETVRGGGGFRGAVGGGEGGLGGLQALPDGLSVLQMEKCAQDLGNSTKAVSSAIAHLLGEIAQGNENYTGTWFCRGCDSCGYNRGSVCLWVACPVLWPGRCPPPPGLRGQGLILPYSCSHIPLGRPSPAGMGWGQGPCSSPDSGGRKTAGQGGYAWAAHP